MKESMIRGYSIRRTAAFIHTYFEGAERARALAAFSQAEWEQFRAFDPGAWYPRKYSCELFNAIAAVKNDPDGSFSDLVECGSYIANEGLNFAVRLMLKFISPQQVAGRINELWKRDQQGGEFGCGDVGPRQVELILSGVADYPHIGPIAVGYLTAIWAAMGKRGTEIEQTGWTLEQPAPNENRYRVTWSA
jgi:hypothetical protein